MSDKENHTGHVAAWLRLFRPPNLLTIPGDPLAGALLAAGTLGIAPHWSAVSRVVGAALALYAAGLVSNDVLDRNTDARERPHRPIPSGAVRPATALAVAVLLTLAGIALAAGAGRTGGVVAVMLAATLWLYNRVGKRSPLLAPLNMGACRGLSLLMGAGLYGAAGLTSIPVLVAAAAQTLYVAGITLTARHEADTWTQCRVPRWIAAALPLTLAAGFAVPFLSRPPLFNLAAGLALMSIGWAVLWGLVAVRASSPRTIQEAVGALIRGLTLAQAAWCAFAGPEGQGVALLILVAFPVSGWIGRWFYGS